MAEQKETQNDLQKIFSKEKLNAILDSPLFRISGYIFTVIGSITIIVNFITNHNIIIAKIGIISLCIGMLGIVVYAIFARKKIKKLTAELRKKNQETQKEITTISSISILNEIKDIEQSPAPNNNSNANESSSDIKFWDEDNLPISTVIFGQNFRTKYQNIPILQQPNSSILTIKQIYSDLCKSTTQDEEGWFDGEKTDSFSRIYANTSVLYFFIQLGLELENPIIEKAYEYLDNIKEIHNDKDKKVWFINKRAKWFFYIQTNKIREPELWNFLKEIKDWQTTKGAFPAFPQEDIDPNKKEAYHELGSLFHTCLMADILLHISPSHNKAREKAKEILKDIASYLKDELKDDGFLYANNEPSLRLTTWYYALSERLGNQLPKNWEDNLIKILSEREKNILNKSFLVMNLAELISVYLSNMKETTIEKICNYFETYYNDLSINNELNNINLSIFGRALLYCNFAIGNDLRNIYKTIIE